MNTRGMKKSYRIVVAVLWLAGCASRNGCLFHDARFDETSLREGGLAVAGVVSARRDLSSEEESAYSALLPDAGGKDRTRKLIETTLTDVKGGRGPWSVYRDAPKLLATMLGDLAEER